ncbi:MAG: helix-turn-helix transcriptional regulator [Clostridia bacterium]|nr:helix-turn-helix transcriptional regulator [Clostridia bacterium]
MFRDEFKSRYNTIPFAFHKKYYYDLEFNLIAHQHKELELIAMVEGTADFYVDSVLYTLKAGDVLVIPPYCIHRANVYTHTYYDCICFDLSLLWDEALRIGLEKGTLTVNTKLSSKFSHTTAMNQCIRSAVKACEQNCSGWEMQAIGNLSVMFGQLKEASFFVKSKTAIPEHRFEKSVYEYVTKHFFEPITSRTVSKELHLNNSYFCRLFKKSFGCCFAEYLMEYRIEKARLFLKNSEHSISEIALKTGFNSFSYFSKVFKSIVGEAPSEYRKRASKI